MTVNLDRFAQGFQNVQDIAPVTKCEACGAEIYPGEDVYVIDGGILHAEVDCLVRFINPELITIEEALKP